MKGMLNLDNMIKSLLSKLKNFQKPQPNKLSRSNGPEHSDGAAHAIERSPQEKRRLPYSQSNRKKRRSRKPLGIASERHLSAPNGTPSEMRPEQRDLKFGEIKVSGSVMKALREMQYLTPTPIQSRVIDPMLHGIDIVGQAQTGTGKTAGFGIPMVELVEENSKHVQAIVLVPTRELAVQVRDEIANIAKYRGIRVVGIFGGQPIKRQLDNLEKGAHIIVGTPGRIIDHLERGSLRTGKVKLVVLDEADQMLDIGFFPDIRKILRMTPKLRQTALFSATVPTQIRRLIYSYLQDPEWIVVGQESVPVEKIRQMYCEVAERDKSEVLIELLSGRGAGQTLVFRRTQIGTDKLVPVLQRRGYSAKGIHGGMSQNDRNVAMRDFRNGQLQILIATNLASRGLDIPAVEHVINYDMPDNFEEYIHRIGRTARMGREGTAMTFVAEWDLENFDIIAGQVGMDNLEMYQAEIYRPSHDNRAVSPKH